MMASWMVRAGRSGRFFDDFRTSSMVAVGWQPVGDLSGLRSPSDFASAVRRAYPLLRQQGVINASVQLYRFACEFAEGDRVVTYDAGARQYLCGTVDGDYYFDKNEENSEIVNKRKVRWNHEKSRECLSDASRNTLGSSLTIFRIPNDISNEMWAVDGVSGLSAESIEPDISMVPPPEPSEEFGSDDVALLANEAIKDRIANLTWQEMQELVAGLLRAMGYKTIVSPPGPDRGRDILASPDGFGFQPPRIVVEVKHRINTRISSQDIRSFIGGRRHSEDRGLYVSTGGFTSEARYEADRATIPIMLMDFESLSEAIMEYYHLFDEQARQIMPLRRLYWPVRS